MADIQKYSEQTFESIKHINEYGQEFWYARELQTALEYTEWRNFKKIIDKAKDACATSGNPVGEHFVEVNKSSPMPNGGVREVEDFMLSRYACYLIVMNGDPRKEVIAVGQTYFAIKTRQQELVENYDELTENQKRIAIRHEMAEHNKSLAEAAQMVGVATSLDYATFQKGRISRQAPGGALRTSLPVLQSIRRCALPRCCPCSRRSSRCRAMLSL